jgi:hypothetical protein
VSVVAQNKCTAAHRLTGNIPATKAMALCVFFGQPNIVKEIFVFLFFCFFLTFVKEPLDWFFPHPVILTICAK